MKPRWLCGVLFLVGCGSVPPLSPQELCEGVQKSHCARLYQCATTPTIQAALQSMYADEADCVRQGIDIQRTPCDQLTEEKACGTFGAAWNGAAARTCLSDLEAQSCVKALTGVTPGSCTPGDYCL